MDGSHTPHLPFYTTLLPSKPKQTKNKLLFLILPFLKLSQPFPFNLQSSSLKMKPRKCAMLPLLGGNLLFIITTVMATIITTAFHYYDHIQSLQRIVITVFSTSIEFNPYDNTKFLTSGYGRSSPPSVTYQKKNFHIYLELSSLDKENKSPHPPNDMEIVCLKYRTRFSFHKILKSP